MSKHYEDHKIEDIRLGLSYLIDSTPTGGLRNKLTDINIAFMAWEFERSQTEKARSGSEA